MMIRIPKGETFQSVSKKLYGLGIGPYGWAKPRRKFTAKPKPAPYQPVKPYGPDNPAPNRTVAGPVRSSMPDGWGGGYKIYPLKKG